MSDEPREEELQALLWSQLTIPLWPHAGKALKLSKNSTYAAAHRGQIPIIEMGGVFRVPTAPFRKMLGLEKPPASRSAEMPAGQAA